MDKIKQVFSSSSKHGDETGESRAAASTGAHSSEREHPIYDQMTGHGTSSTAQSTTAGTTAAGQTGISSGLGKSDNLHESDRPSTLSASHGNEGMSQASIKSGVIGFGSGEQGHAALPSNNQAEDNLQRNQIVGGGDPATGATQGTSAQSGFASQTTPHSGLDTRDQTGAAATAFPGSASKTSNTQAPFDQNLRQESYTADTDRSFPLAGGVAPKHASNAPTSTHHQETNAPLSSTHQQATTAPLASSNHGTTAAPLTSTARDTPAGTSTSTHHPITSEREPGTKEKSAGVHDGYGREGLAAAAGAAAVAAPLAHSQQKSVHDQGLETRQATYGDQLATAPISSMSGNTAGSNTQEAHPEALAAARAAAAKSGAHETDGTAGGYGLSRPSGHRTESRPHVPGEFPSPTPDESKTFLYYRSDLVPEPGAETKLTPGHHAMHDQTLAPTSGTTASTSSTAGTTSTAGPHASNALNKADPRVDSDRDGSTTLGSTTGTSAPHELRHTGTLEEPRPKSSEHEDHTGRNAALAGGLAGAAGLGYATSQKHDSSHVGADTASPYSSTALDPRVMGNSSKLNEQRFDPQARSTESTTHHALQTSNPAGITAAGTSTSVPSTATASTAADPSATSVTRSSVPSEGGSATTATGPVHKSSLLNKLDPRVKEDGSKTVHAGEANTIPADKEAKEHHYGRDAALVGGGAAAGAGVHHAMKRDDAPGSTSTTGISRDSNTLGSTTAPLSSSTANTTGTSAPLSSSTASTGGASAPLSSTTANTSAPLSSSTGPARTADKKDADHHYGRDAALVGGGAATAAGIHHAAERNDAGPTASTVPSQTGPTASAPLTSSNATAAHTTAPLSSATTPSQAGTTDPQHHYGRDAALVGGGAATAAGVRHQLQRNDTPGTGTTVLPQDSLNPGAGSASSSAAPVSSTAASSHSAAPVASTAAPSSTTAAPVTSSHTRDLPTGSASKNVSSYTGPLTTSGEPFYGTAGAPAPVADKKSSERDHHGRDAALVGGAAAGAGGLAYASHHDKKAETGPASSTIGPHSSNVANVLDPRVQPDPSRQSHHQAGSTTQDPASRTIGPHDSNVANVLDPRVQPDPSKQRALNPATDARADKDHHYGRDAAIAGGTGAAGYGAYEAAKSYGDHRSTQPAAAMAEQRYDPTTTGAHAPNPVPTSGHYDYNNPLTSRNVNEPSVGHHDSTSGHASRNAGLGAAAVGGGALAGGAYAGSKHGETHQAPPSSTQPLAGTTQPATSSYPQTAYGAAQAAPGTTQEATHSRYDSTQVPEDDHTKRNAALAGAGGVAAAGGAYAYSQQHDAEKERDRMAKEEQERLKKEQHAHDKEQKKLDKEHHKEEKQAHKEEKEQHKHDKIVAAHAKEEKKHQKEEEKEAARLEKERQKEAERHEKEAEKDEKKKHGILGFLHRDKSKKEKHGSNDSSPRNSGDIRRSTDNPRHSKEYAAGGAALGAGTTAAAYDHDNHPDSPRWKGKNLLHKDPPEGHPAREALGNKDDIELTGGKREHMGVDGPIGRPDAISGYNETRAGVYGAQPLNEVPENNKVIEPHTGLPMNVGRYGDGAGGTDGSTNIHGHHQHAGAGQATGSNLEEIKKKDTIY